MVKRILLVIAFIVVAFSAIGCQTAEGIKEDLEYIGDKTYELIDGD